MPEYVLPPVVTQYTDKIYNRFNRVEFVKCITCGGYATAVPGTTHCEVDAWWCKEGYHDATYTGNPSCLVPGDYNVV